MLNFKMIFVPLCVNFFANFALAAELLTPNHIIYSQMQSEEFGFVAGKNEPLQNPPPNKVRIYGVRSRDFIGEKASYEAFYQYEPQIEPNIKGQIEPVISQSAYIGNIFGKFSNASKFYKDFEAGKPLLLLAELETNSYIVFTPSAGRIYCVQGAIILGLHKARPNLKLINKAQCERIYRELE